MKFFFALFAIIVGMLFCSGCSTGRGPTQASAPVAVPGDFARLNFDFILVNASNSSPALATETRLLQDSILSGLRETGLFPDVQDVNTNGTTAGGIKILASIKQITKVSKSSREWFGGFAGKAHVVVQVTISDLATGKSIETFEADGWTGASAWAGGTDEAIEKAAAKVVAEVSNLNSKAAREQIF